MKTVTASEDQRIPAIKKLLWIRGLSHFGVMAGEDRRRAVNAALARSERFELPTLGIEIRCSIQLSYERAGDTP
jgi:hypothetical protein